MRWRGQPLERCLRHVMSCTAGVSRYVFKWWYNIHNTKWTIFTTFECTIQGC